MCSPFLRLLTFTVLISVAATRPVSPHQPVDLLAPAAGHGLEPWANAQCSSPARMLAFGLPFLAGKAHLGGGITSLAGRRSVCGLSERPGGAEVRVGPPLGRGARMALQGAVAGDKKAGGYQRWWDPSWRAVRLSEAKNPERQFSKEHLEMAGLMGVTPEELAKSMSATTAVELDGSEYDALLAHCVRAAKAGDILGMVQAGEVLDKMEQVGLKPSVEAYNGVIAACAASAGGKFLTVSYNDTDARAPFIQRAVDLVSFSGGRLDSKEFGKKWRARYPNETLGDALRAIGSGKVTVAAVLKDSPRFQVSSDPANCLSKFVLLRKESVPALPTVGALKGKSTLSASAWITVAMGYLEKMKKNKLQPDGETFAALIGMCARAAAAGDTDATTQAFALVDAMKGTGVSVSRRTYNALLHVCAAANEQERASEVEVMLAASGEAADAYTWSARISLAAGRSLQEAEQSLRGAHEEGCATVAVVNGYLGAIARTPDPRATGAIMRAYDAADRYLGGDKGWDKHTYLAILTLLGRAGKDGVPGVGEKAVALLDRAVAAGCVDAKMFTSTLLAVASDVCDRPSADAALKRAKSALSDAQASDIKPDVRLLGAAISAAAKAAEWIGLPAVETARDLVKKAPKAGVKLDLQSRTAMLDALANAARAQGGARMSVEADKYLDEIKFAGAKPSATTYNVVLKALAQAAEAGAQRTFERGKTVLARMKRDGVNPRTDSFNTLILIAARGRDLGKRRRVDRAIDRGLDSLERMRAAKCIPDETSFNTLLLCARSAREVRLVLVLMKEFGFAEQVGEAYKLAPRAAASALRALRFAPGDESAAFVEHLLAHGEFSSEWQHAIAAGIDLLRRSNKFPEAVEMLFRGERGGAAPNAITYSLALKAAVASGDKSLVSKVLEALAEDGKVARTSQLEAQLAAV